MNGSNKVRWDLDAFTEVISNLQNACVDLEEYGSHFYKVSYKWGGYNSLIESRILNELTSLRTKHMAIANELKEDLGVLNNISLALQSVMDEIASNVDFIPIDMETVGYIALNDMLDGKAEMYETGPNSGDWRCNLSSGAVDLIYGQDVEGIGPNSDILTADKMREALNNIMGTLSKNAGALAIPLVDAKIIILKDMMKNPSNFFDSAPNNEGGWVYTPSEEAEKAIYGRDVENINMTNMPPLTDEEKANLAPVDVFDDGSSNAENPQTTEPVNGATAGESNDNPQTTGGTNDTPVHDLDSGGPAPQDTYKIKKGDNLTQIAKKYNCTVEELIAANKDKIKDKNLIYIGDSLNIPSGDDIPLDV